MLLPVLFMAGAAPALSSTQAPLHRLDPAAIGALVKNPAAYARQKAVANARYARWAQRHGIAVRTSTRPLTSVSLSHTGLAASDPYNDVPPFGASTPPDTTGAIGPSDYVEMVNSEVAVYSNSNLGTPIAAIDEPTFFNDPSASTCDGQIQWDQEGQRWLYSGLNCNAGFGNENLYVGFSKGTSPLPLDSTNWCQYQIPTNSNLEDYDKLGHDNTQIIIGANQFEFDGFGNFDGGEIFVLPKPAPGTLTNCPTYPNEVTNSLVTLSVPDAFTPVPANIADSSADGYVVAEDNANTTSQLDLYDITTSVSNGTMLPTTTVAVPSYAVPAAVPQPGTTDTIDSLDGRLTQAVAVTDPGTGQEGIWTQHTIDGGGPSVVRWYELTPGATTPTQVGTVRASNGAFAFAGAISPSSNGGDAALFYNTGSSTQLPDLQVEDRHRYTKSGEMVEGLQLATSAYEDSDFSCPSWGWPSCRWGDYAGASPDPSNAALVWGSGELTVAAPDFVNGTPQWGSENAAIDVTAAANYTLNVSTAGHGSGSVTSTDTQINCPGTCAHTYAYDTPVTLTAAVTPDTHSIFDGWSGDCTGTGACDLPMGGPQNVTANFSLEQKLLSYTQAGNGTGFVTSSPTGIGCGSSCSHNFDWNTQVELTATPGTGSTFTGWSGDCTVVNGKCDVSMDQARSVTATFTLVPETLTVSKAGAGSGTVSSTVAGISCGSTCAHAWDYGTSVTLTETPETGSQFTGWTGACTGTGSCTVSLDAAKSVTATFGLIPETLAVTKSGSGSGTVTSDVAGIDCGASCLFNFAYGTSVTLTATPGTHVAFNGWSGACSGTGDCTVPMTAATSVRAKFTKLFCLVPNLKGKTPAAAAKALKKANCKLGTTTKASSTTGTKGKVISQSAKPGKHLAFGAKVNIVIRK